MASEEHKKLAGFIKATHNQLREDSRAYGPSEAWNRHLSRIDVLQNYATSMQKLATEHWKKPTSEQVDDSNCRNSWIKSQCQKYFFNCGIEKFDKKESDIKKKARISGNYIDCADEMINQSKAISVNRSSTKIQLLDVGSCYNPLADEEAFDVTAIDLAPYSSTVLQCDFLNVELGSEMILSRDRISIEQLKKVSYDVIVFSLLLEYFPCPEQRFICCEKAYKLLKPGGILLIISPDSNHLAANAKIMKSWRLVLSRMGFMRFVYEKTTHLHCLGFRKCYDKCVAVRWAELQDIADTDALLNSKGRIYIPQDFQTVKMEKECANIVYNSEELASCFNELPCMDETFS